MTIHRKFLVLGSVFCWFAVCAACTVCAQTLYLFSEGDIHDENVGKCVDAAISHIANGVMGNMPENRVVLYNDPNDYGSRSRRWTGPDISTSYDVHGDILKAIDQCPAGSNDTIFFYWCGHGAFDEGGHFLWMPKNRGPRAMRRSEIQEALERKGVRLVVFITESCHVLQRFPEPERIPGAIPRDDVPPLFRSLFFDVSGVVDVNSSSPGQTSEADLLRGGAFTYYLSTSFSEWAAERYGWKDIFEEIDDLTEQEGLNQTVYIWSLPGISKGDVWSAPNYHPEKGDRIIAVNEFRVNSESEFREAIRESDSEVILTVLDKRTGNRYYLMTKLLPRDSWSRLGIYVTDSRGPGVEVTGVLSDLPGNHCRYLKNGDVSPVRSRAGVR